MIWTAFILGLLAGPDVKHKMGLSECLARVSTARHAHPHVISWCATERSKGYLILSPDNGSRT